MDVENRLRKLIVSASLLLALVFYSKVTLAVQQGELDDEESYGEINFEIEIAELTQISDLDDFYFSNWDMKSNMQQSDQVCVYSNSASGKYHITARGSGSGYAFEVTNGEHNVPYDAYWKDKITGSGIGKKLKPNKQLKNRKRGSKTHFDCNGLTNAVITIRFLKDDLEGATGSSYHGNLILEIAPI